MAPPDNFKGVVFPLDFRERPASPTPSYMSLRTDMSIDAPNNFKREQTFHMDTRVGSERAPSPTLSSVSELTECFVERPTNFKAEETYHLGPRLLTENCLKCPVCKSILKDPVSIPCGHNFCRDCINSSWDSAEDYACPQCERGYRICPELNTNTALAEVVKHLQQAGFSPALPPCSYAGPEDVACDLCSDQRLKAVKTCLTCGVYLCETHIRSHYTIPALQKHTLSDVTGAMEKKLSTQNLPTDNFSSICGEQEKDRSMSESGLNTSMANEDAGISTPETDVKTNLELMYSKLQQEVLGLKESFSKFKKHNTKTDKYVWEGSDDEESYKDSDEEENENSYDEEDSFNYDIDNDSEMDKSDESKSENDNDDEDEYNVDEDNEYDEEEDHYEYDEDEDNDNSDEEDEYDVDEYGY
ncbi:putative E3 ubiquitin/ISG15 ligase TRIM25 [Triplophysa rosa]|uniref:E3 ubiquitin/ISG15 ligase TRIM25 n=2 Tax=Triplophysa rosa TaxID=992332 RepID=A0A9W7WE14_TRIRA|nr:putative E3 ubiquitin/ISG15 ligase TRIM25 [Triplophysa rosa]